MDANFISKSKVKEFTATGKVLFFWVSLLLGCCLEAGKLRELFRIVNTSRNISLC